MKRILIIYYSQTGQLKDIVDQIADPLSEDQEYEIDYYQIKMVQEFPFPWNRASFFDVFPESFQQIPSEILPPPEDILSKKYDLILFSYQVWFLSPSIPVVSFLKSKYAPKILSQTKIITVIGCRNMWVMAQEKTKKLLTDNNGQLVGNITLVDRNPNHISVLTIVHWLFKGKKSRMFGFFPKPGVSDKDINESSKFGEIIKKSLDKSNLDELQNLLINQGAIITKPFLIIMDRKANKMFKIWSKMILSKKSNRRLKLYFFNIYLWFAIWMISPIVYVFHIMTYPLRYRKINKSLKEVHKV